MSDYTMTQGIDLRDWFAGLAVLRVPNNFQPEGCASEAYKIADAMLAEREKRKK